MPRKSFIPKDDQALPDSYTVKIQYVTGKEETIEVASHRLIEQVILKELRDATGKVVEVQTAPHPAPFFEFWTKDDMLVNVTLSNVTSIHFDKNWTKVVQIYREKNKK